MPVTTHGLSYTREYQVWRDMIRRCTDPRSEKYHRYGGRGITVCQRWLDSVEAFVADVGKAPSRKHMLDRIDNDGNYEPDNVRWATNKEQSLNKSQNRPLTFQGRTQTIGEWAKELGIKRTTIRMRLDEYGWTVEQALSVKPKRSGRPTDAEIEARQLIS